MASHEDLFRAIARYLEVWNQGRPEGLSRFYTEDGDLIAADGSRLKGRMAIEQYYREGPDGPYAELKLRNPKLLAHRSLSGEWTVVDASCEVHGTEGEVIARPIGTYVGRKWTNPCVLRWAE